MILKIKTVIIFILLLSAIQVFASADAGRYSAEFLYFGTGARALSMGRAFTAVTGDPNNMYWNPSGLSLIKDRTLSYTLNQLVENSSYNNITYIHPLSKNILGASLGFVSYGREDRYEIGDDNHPEKMGGFDGNDLVAQISLANMVIDNKLYIGASGKYLYSKIAGYSASSFAVDAGITARASKELTIGGVIQNLGTNLKYLNRKEKLPITLKLGAAYEVLGKYTLFSLDIVKKGSQNLFIAAGGETKLYERIKLRAGYNSLNDAGSGLSMGVGYYNKNFTLDYAYIPYGDIGSSHKFSLSYRFGLEKEEKTEENLYGTVNIPPRKVTKKLSTPSLNFEKFVELGYYNFKNENYRLAIANFIKALELKPLYVNGRLWLAFSYTKIGNFEAAEREYNKVLSIEPHNRNAMEALKLLQKKKDSNLPVSSEKTSEEK